MSSNPSQKLTPEKLWRSPNALAPHYSRFRVDETPESGRLLLTGHSHQAWPDRAFDGHQQAFLDAAEFVDDKWENAFAMAQRVHRGYARLLGDRAGTYTLAANTHDLVLRFLSALPLDRRPKLVTTDGEFHSIRRQFDRLTEEGWVEIVRVPADAPDTLVDRLIDETDDRTAAVLVSGVLFQSGRRVPGLDRIARAAQRCGAEILIDVYHAVGAIPFELDVEGLERAFLVGGGYKYCQMGEGVAFLRVPPDCLLRPMITGWFAEFDTLGETPVEGRVAYGRGANRFAGATYDPTSHYRAAAVLDFWDEIGLEPHFLRAVSRHQIDLLAEGFDDLDLDPRTIARDRGVPLDQYGAFLVLQTPRAGEISRELHRRGVRTDFRGDSLRLGPAPYLNDAQLRNGLAVLGEAVGSLPR